MRLFKLYQRDIISRHSTLSGKLLDLRRLWRLKASVLCLSITLDKTDRNHI